jgi:hypothetical protein
MMTLSIPTFNFGAAPRLVMINIRAAMLLISPGFFLGGISPCVA